MNPVTGRITSKFGSRRHPITGIVTLHNGIDIACVAGTPVKAPEEGTVIQVWEHIKGGKCVAMVGKTCRRYGFAHLSGQLVTVGQQVTEGQVIARSGNTGQSTGPHLHFTVQENGYWRDPLNYFDFK